MSVETSLDGFSPSEHGEDDLFSHELISGVQALLSQADSLEYQLTPEQVRNFQAGYHQSDVLKIRRFQTFTDRYSVEIFARNWPSEGLPPLDNLEDQIAPFVSFKLRDRLKDRTIHLDRRLVSGQWIILDDDRIIQTESQPTIDEKYEALETGLPIIAQAISEQLLIENALPRHIAETALNSYNFN